MALKSELSTSDLEDIRQSALGAADPLGVAAELAEAADAGRLADPDDAGYALVLAAEIAESRSKHDAALRYVDRGLEAYGKRDDGRAGAARALRARVLFRVGRSDEAWAELEPLRPLLTRETDAPAYIGAALAVGGRNRDAEVWLTDAVQAVLKERADQKEPTSADEAGLLFFLLQQRHRVRHALGLPHDTHDNLAERLETRLANASARTTAGSDDDLLFFGRDEFAASGSPDADWDAHRARLETALVRQARAGRTGLVLLRGSVAGLQGYAGSDGDLADPETRAGYARQVAAVPGGGISWPPERNAACWCGSGSKYKKCCLPRSR